MKTVTIRRSLLKPSKNKQFWNIIEKELIVIFNRKTPLPVYDFNAIKYCFSNPLKFSSVNGIVGYAKSYENYIMTIELTDFGEDLYEKYGDKLRFKVICSTRNDIFDQIVCLYIEPCDEGEENENCNH